MDEVTEESELNEVLQHILDHEELHEAAEGIVRQVLDRGVNSLTEKQRAVYDRQIVKEYIETRCDRCGIEIPLSELVVALQDSDSFRQCGYCQHVSDKARDD